MSASCFRFPIHNLAGDRKRQPGEGAARAGHLLSCPPTDSPPPGPARRPNEGETENGPLRRRSGGGGATLCTCSEALSLLLPLWVRVCSKPRGGGGGSRLGAGGETHGQGPAARRRTSAPTGVRGRALGWAAGGGAGRGGAGGGPRAGQKGGRRSARLLLLLLLVSPESLRRGLPRASWAPLAPRGRSRRRASCWGGCCSPSQVRGAGWPLRGAWPGGGSPGRLAAGLGAPGAARPLGALRSLPGGGRRTPRAPRRGEPGLAACRARDPPAPASRVLSGAGAPAAGPRGRQGRGGRGLSPGGGRAGARRWVPGRDGGAAGASGLSEAVASGAPAGTPHGIPVEAAGRQGGWASPPPLPGCPPSPAPPSPKLPNSHCPKSSARSPFPGEGRRRVEWPPPPHPSSRLSPTPPTTPPQLVPPRSLPIPCHHSAPPPLFLAMAGLAVTWPFSSDSREGDVIGGSCREDGVG